jgi:hypothetical protein
MHVYIKEGMVHYRMARPVGYPQSAGKLLAGDVREDSRVGTQEALQFADKHWGNQLYNTAPKSARRPNLDNQKWSFQ